MVDIAVEIHNTLATTQILIVFILFLFTLFYSDIQKMLKETPDDDVSFDNKELKEEIIETFWYKSFILFVSTLLIFLLFVPVVKQINFNESLNNEIVQFLLIFVFVFGFFLWSMKLMIHLIYTIIVKFKGY
ncbi:MAG: hypothetical protein GYA51_03930 [Candidatus Methanofastidiosa archaeon]|nr:hypothetical protein [Candidatus Methanofastidiosa archaeon]